MNLYDDVRLEDCFVYHWFDTPDGKTIPGVWDLRQNWRSYLGNLNLKGRTVLEIGPASGFLTFKMEREGANVTCFDVGPGISPDVMPMPGSDLDQTREKFARDTHSVRAAWWYFRKMFGSSSKAIYGNIYEMPEMGDFDVGVVGAVLLHLANPFGALAQICKRVRHTMIVIDLYDPRLDGGSFMEINPHLGKAGPMAWWLISPQAVKHMLHACGFEVTSLTFNEFSHHPTIDPKVSRKHEFFTVVATRRAATGPTR